MISTRRGGSFHWLAALEQGLARGPFGNLERPARRGAGFWQTGNLNCPLAGFSIQDGMIDRALKRLLQAKGMKQMLASPSLNGRAQQPKSISISKRAEA